jgi:isocitrate dehydrogenase kinase/phosphatase
VSDKNNNLISNAANTIFASFEDYNQEFRVITQRAHRRFEEREWKLGQRDAVERIELYDNRVVACLASLVGVMGAHIADQNTWRQVRDQYGEKIASCTDGEFYKTFFNSLTRKAFNTIGVNAGVEFLAPDLEPTLNGSEPPVRSYLKEDSLIPIAESILEQFPSARLFRDFTRSTRLVVDEIHEYVETYHQGDPVKTVEMLAPVFYRGTRGYLVGRIQGDGWIAPLILAFKNGDDGVIVDAVIMSNFEARSLFGFSRSYLHVDLPAVGAAVKFLRSFMPRKGVDELYTVLGRAKQGKTERYRRLYKHLTSSTDDFLHAEGQPGMVMIVFTLPSYDLVFKVIRDRFAFPKTTSRADVMDRYQLVFKHDRAGRLVDAQEFRQLRFSKSRFSEALRAELLDEACQVCRVDGDDLIIEHCYIERRLRPLNLYLHEVNEPAARRAVIDYGQAIKDLARSNVFPGDLLLKNFGVTANGRIIFYDYDELCLVTDCSFRDLPSSRFEEDETRAEPWFYVGKNDVFPEQFTHFLGLSQQLRETFMQYHKDLLTADYWRSLKSSHKADKLLEVIPYADRSISVHQSIAG